MTATGRAAKALKEQEAEASIQDASIDCQIEEASRLLKRHPDHFARTYALGEVRCS